MSMKRNAELMTSDSDSDVSPPKSKKPTVTKSSTKKTTTKGFTTLTSTELSELSHDELLRHAITLTKELTSLKKSSPATQDLSPEDLKKKVQQLQTLMERQIRKAMTWKPSCKTGSATFSQEFIVQNEQVFKKLFKPVVKETGKAWKMKKFSVAEFEEVVGDNIQASSRYISLNLSGDVTVRWNPEHRTMKCSGKYGK